MSQSVRTFLRYALWYLCWGLVTVIALVPLLLAAFVAAVVIDELGLPHGLTFPVGLVLGAMWGLGIFALWHRVMRS